ncbi:hypothetical protein F909_00514 [Acinetobacter sp. ANC 3929]|nr:hypothetical protein F909_00514 [Acinetobacter sp. ANC 3929]
MKNKLKKFLIPILFFALWLIGSLNIVLSGNRIDDYLIRHDPEYIFKYPFEGVIFSWLIFSVYFITQALSFLLSFNRKHPTLYFIVCSVIVTGQFFIAYLTSMHAPPYWGAYLINTIFLFLFQLFVLPALLHKKKSS